MRWNIPFVGLLFFAASARIAFAGTPPVAPDKQDAPDTTPPVITLIGDPEVTLECGQEYHDPGVTAFDDVDGDLTADIRLASTGCERRSCQLLYFVADQAGNRAAVARIVNWVDTTPPWITLNGSAYLMVDCFDIFVDPGANAYDICDGDIAVVVLGTVDPFSYTGSVLTYMATDSAGNTASTSRFVMCEGETWCIDVDDNGLPDDIFFCLGWESEIEWWNSEAGACLRSFYGVGLPGTPTDDSFTAVLSNPNAPEKDITVELPTFQLPPENRGVAVILDACAPEDLLGAEVNYLQPMPYRSDIADIWIAVNGALRSDDEYRYVNLSPDDLKDHPISITISDLDVSADSRFQIWEHDTYLTPRSELGDVIAASRDTEWKTITDYRYADGALSFDVDRYGLIGVDVLPPLPPNLELAPAPGSGIDFGNVRLYTDKVFTSITMQNSGGGSLVCSASISPASAGFSLAPHPVSYTLLAGQSQAVAIVFQPLATGPAAATLTVSNSAGPAITVSLVGNGLSPQKKFLVAGCNDSVPNGLSPADIGTVLLVLATLILFPPHRLRLTK